MLAQPFSLFKVLVVVTVLLCASCDKTPLLPLNKGLPIQGTAVIAGNYCNLNLVDVPGLKIYLVQDVTGSNQQGDSTDNGVQTAPTDPDQAGNPKPKRTKAMQDLASKFPHALFALRTFAGNALQND